MQTFSSIQYLKIDIANNFGLDKLSWDDRLIWFEQNQNNLNDLVHLADEPALFYAGMRAYEATLRGEPTGYMISLDATSSGLQLLAALTGDTLAAQLCNVISTGSREDAYMRVYEEMLSRIGETAKISRDDCKQAIMTAFYGSQAVPKEVFGEGHLLNIFFATMKALAPAAWELNETMLKLWNDEAYSNDWVLPDNFHVHIKVMNRVKGTVHFLNQPFEVFETVNMPVAEGRSLGANTIHSIDGMIVREMSRRCDYDPKMIDNLKKILMFEKDSPREELSKSDEMVLTLWNHYNNSGFLSARILEHLSIHNIHFVDRTIINDLLASLPIKPFKVVAIHDCFRCHPNYGNDLRKQYNNLLMLIAKSNLLNSIISQLVGRKVDVGKYDQDMWMHVATTNYALS